MPHTLLLADDSVTIQRVIELTFADQDVAVVAVGNGDEAIARLEASPPDIVLADIGMPGKNGYEVAQYIRQSPKLAHIPVILLTGAFEPVDQARANRAGCDSVLAKPFEPQLVIGRVKDLLARSRRNADVPAPEGHAPGIEAGEVPAVQSLTDPPLAPGSNPDVPAAELNDYFDRLDAAFSTLSAHAARPHPTPAWPVADAPHGVTESDLDWFGHTSGEGGRGEPWVVSPAPFAAEPADLPLSPPSEGSFSPGGSSSSPAGADRGAVADLIAAAAPDTPDREPVPPPQDGAAAAAAPALALPMASPPPLPALADAFAALLAAEQGEPDRSIVWPAASPKVSEELIEAVTRRVLDHLSGSAMRETVADVASKAAERLVREEIERIKASIK